MQEIPLSDLAVYSNKIENHIDELKKMLHRLAVLKADLKYFDKDKKKEDVIISKLEECQEVYNKIQLEIEARSEKVLNFNFEYDTLTTIQTLINSTFHSNNIAKAKKEKGNKNALN